MPFPTIIKPDYSHANFNITNSLLKHYGFDPYHDTLKEVDELLTKRPKNVVLMILDGLGTSTLKQHNAPFLKSHHITDLTTIFPSTTVAAMSSLETGLTPREHGWIAWSCYFKNYNYYIEYFSGVDNYTKKPTGVDVSMLIPKTPLFKVIQCSHTIHPYFANNHCKTIEQGFEYLSEICNNGNGAFVYFYWDDIDKLSHKHGNDSDKVANFISKVDNLLEQTHLQDTLIIITADHGHTNIKEHILLNDIYDIYNSLVMPPSMERRFMSFVVKHDKRDVFVSGFQKSLANDFVLYEKSKYIDLLGMGQTHPTIDDFVGDFVAIAKSDKSLLFKVKNGVERELDVSMHGGLTESEMIVPLIAIARH